MTNLEKFRITLLSEDRLKKAFEKTQTEVSIPAGKLVRVTEEYYDKAITFMMESFVKDEPMAIAVKAGEENREEFVGLWKSAFEKKLSLMLLGHTSDNVIGVRVISTGTARDQSSHAYKDTGLRKLSLYSKYCADMAKFFDHFDVTERIRFVGLGVNANYRQRGIASQLMNAALLFVKNLGFASVCVQGEGTSNFSQKIYQKNGFDILFEHQYVDYKVDGEQIVCNTGEHKSIKLYGKRIS